MDPGGPGVIQSTQGVPPNPSPSAVDPGASGAIQSAQIVTQRSQLVSGGVLGSSTQALKKFYKGEPFALGITQIFTGMIVMAFGIVLDMSKSYGFSFFLLRSPYWIGITYIISGALSVAAAKNPKKALVKGMLGMNVVSAITAGLDFLVSLVLLELLNAPWDTEHYETTVIPHIQFGMTVVLMVFTALEFCITISTAAFGCQLTCDSTYNETDVRMSGRILAAWKLCLMMFDSMT